MLKLIEFSRFTSLQLRLITAFVGLPLLLLILYFGSGSLLIVWVLLAIVVSISIYELCTMMEQKLGKVFAIQNVSNEDSRHSFSNLFFKSTAILIGFVFFAVNTLNPFPGSLGFLVFFVFFILIIGFFSSSRLEVGMGRIFILLLCLGYCVLPWVIFYQLVFYSSKLEFALLVLAIVWSGDTGAYFGGRIMGKRKLYPKLSPNKTVEGAIWGLFASVFAAYLMSLFFNFAGASVYQLLFAGLLGGFFGQIGDLVESGIKRFSEMKDSGNLLPGHGRILDRTDAIISAAPVIWLLLIFNL